MTGPRDDPASEDGWLDYDDDDVEDDLDLYEDECGMTDEGLCMYAGSEWCDWSCPRERMGWCK